MFSENIVLLSVIRTLDIKRATYMVFGLKKQLAKIQD